MYSDNNLDRKIVSLERYFNSLSDTINSTWMRIILYTHLCPVTLYRTPPPPLYRIASLKLLGFKWCQNFCIFLHTKGNVHISIQRVGGGP